MSTVVAPRVICIGEALVEMIKVELDASHDTLGHYQGPFPSGAPAIFTSCVGRLAKAHGISVGFIAAVGTDLFGATLIAKLREDGVDTSLIARRPEQATGIAFVQLNRDGSRSFVFSKGAAADVDAAALPPAYFANVAALHISGSALSLDARLRAAVLRALELAMGANPECLVTFDPNFRVEMADPAQTAEWVRPVLARTTHLLPSGAELSFLMQTAELEQACRLAFERAPRLRAIVLKRGAEGCLLFERGSTGATSSSLAMTQVPAFAAEERFPTGAGDNFGGALLVALLAGMSLESAARHATAAGALAVEQPGLMKTFDWHDVERRVASAALGATPTARV